MIRCIHPNSFLHWCNTSELRKWWSQWTAALDLPVCCADDVRRNQSDCLSLFCPSRFSCVVLGT
jgi:hypothetical protein